MFVGGGLSLKIVIAAISHLLPAPVAASDYQKAGLGSLSHRYKRLFERVKLNTEIPRIDLEKDCPKDKDEFRR